MCRLFMPDSSVRMFSERPDADLRLEFCLCVISRRSMKVDRVAFLSIRERCLRKSDAVRGEATSFV